MVSLIWWLVVIGVVWTLAYQVASLSVWTLTVGVSLVVLSKLSSFSVASLIILWAIFLLVLVPLNILPLRRKFLSSKLLKLYRKFMPSMSNTEREALEAGTVSWEGDLFTGFPNWDKLQNMPAGKLTEEEQAFLDGPVNELCSMIDDWDITHNRADMPADMWQFLKDNGFFAFIIPKKYGGKEFSATATMSVLVRVYGRSVSVATTIAVPNSLGPAELLLKYGTEEQKDYYLPRLAKGIDVPCFALTGPSAGSDAASIPDYGIVCKDTFEGKEVLGIRLNWDKRYITLAPAATMLGLAFKLHDPNNLLGTETDLGITCALIPTNTKGVVIGRRHFPLNAAFLNGPTQGRDIFIPMDWVIGGADMVGQGWRMLMECLSAGRAISLPSSALGGAKVAALASGAYSRIRKQFNTPIGRFEGIEEPLARIAGYTYIMDAGLRFTAAAIDQGEKPAVAAAILKYHTTELGRLIAADAMDIHGGKGICLGPSNYIGRGYQGAPIGITVEGANILTRSLMIFGQGAIRCHHYVFDELESALSNDLEGFDKALFAHIGFTVSSVFRSLWLGISGARFVFAPRKSRVKRYYQLCTRYSASFALVAELSMLGLGSTLKRREKLSARLGDILSNLYLCSAVLKKYHDDGEPEVDLPIVRWACRTMLYTIQHRFSEVISNFPNRIIANMMRVLVFPLGHHLSQVSDKLGHEVASLMINPNEARTRLTENAFKAAVDTNPVGKMEESLLKIIAAEGLEKKVQKAIKAGEVTGYTYDEQLADAVKQNIISPAEQSQLIGAAQARDEVIAVDHFSDDELARIAGLDQRVDKEVA